MGRRAAWDIEDIDGVERWRRFVLPRCGGVGAVGVWLEQGMLT